MNFTQENSIKKLPAIAIYYVKLHKLNKISCRTVE